MLLIIALSSSNPSQEISSFSFLPRLKNIENATFERFGGGFSKKKKETIQKNEALIEFLNPRQLMISGVYPENLHPVTEVNVKF